MRCENTSKYLSQISRIKTIYVQIIKLNKKLYLLRIKHLPLHRHLANY